MSEKLKSEIRFCRKVALALAELLSEEIDYMGISLRVDSAHIDLFEEVSEEVIRSAIEWLNKYEFIASVVPVGNRKYHVCRDVDCKEKVAVEYNYVEVEPLDIEVTINIYPE